MSNFSLASEVINKARLYAVMFLFRRTILCLIVLLTHDILNLFIRTLTFVVFQLVYFGYIILLKPFVEFKDNLLEIVNEVIYTIL